MRSIVASVFLSFTFSMSAIADPMTFKLSGTGGNCESCEWIAAEGEIDADVADRFEKYLKDEELERYTFEIRLNSPGGNLIGGIKLGEVFRRRGMSTSVGKTEPDIDTVEKRAPGACASACAFAFLGGVSRSADEGTLGVHQFFDARALEDPTAKVFSGIDVSSNQLISALVTDYIFRMGVDPRFGVIASQTLPSDVHWLTAAELDDMKVNWNPDAFDPWLIEPYRHGVVAFTRSKDQGTTLTMFCRRDRVPTLLIVSNRFKQAAEMREVVASLSDGMDIFGYKVFPGSFSVKEVAGGNVSVEVAMPELKPDALSVVKESGKLDVQFDALPHVYWWYFEYEPSAEKAKETIGVALRNCI